MKNATIDRFILLVLSTMALCQTTASAQVGIFGSPLTNSAAVQSNDFDAEWSRMQSRFDTPFMGTTLERATGGRVPYSPLGPPLESWGPFQLYPHLRYEASYGDALPAQVGSNSTTFINEVAPGLLIKAGRFWTLDYTPTIFFYSNPVFKDKTDQNVVLNGNVTNGDWSLSLSQSYIETTQPLEETGTQNVVQLYATALGATYQMGAKTSLELAANQNFQNLEGRQFNTMHEWKSTDWFNYQFEPQFSAAIGVSGGYDNMSTGSDMPFEQALGRLVFRPGTKLTLSVVAGAEERQFIDPTAASDLNPIFQASGLYQVRAGTLLSCTASRSVVPSLYTNEVNVITTVTAGIHQHIIGKVNLEIEGSYTLEPFNTIQLVRNNNSFGFSTASTEDNIRTDTRESLNVRLSTVFRTRLTASLFCLLINNRSVNSGSVPSSLQGVTYSGVQGGIELDYRY